MTRILNQPLQATTSYIPGTHGNTKFSAEMIMLFWEITQCNKRFRSFMIDTDRSHDFVILILFYALEYRLDTSKQGVVRMCVFLLQTLSVEPNFGKNLNKKFEAQETLPPTIRIQSFNGTYGDFLIHVSCGKIFWSTEVLLTSFSPFTISSLQAKANFMQSIQHYLPLSTTSQLTLKISAPQHAQNYSTSFLRCRLPDSYWQMIAITTFSDRCWRV
jgi:hypothetical protein